MGNRRSSHSSLEEDSRKGSHTGSNTSAKAKQPDKHHSNTKSDHTATPINPGPTSAETPSPRKQPPDKPPPTAKSRLPDLSKYPEDVMKLLLGHSPGVKIKSKPNVVRIFVSSIQDDSVAERVALMETVFPKLREYAATKGVELHIVDPHWGMWDPKLEDGRMQDLCKEEIERCQRLSIGTNFVAFLNQKYGRVTAPFQILASAFDRLLRKLMDMQDRDLLSRCYKLDENAAPSMYILQDDLPSSEGESICRILRNSWSKEEQELYLASALQSEIEQGVFSPHSNSEGTIWVHRHFINISPKDPAARKHLDIGVDGELDPLSQDQLVQLSKRLATKVGQSNFLKFDIPWNSSGLDPDGIESHRKYIEDFCGRIHGLLKEAIDRATSEEELEKEPKRIDNRLYDELLQQRSFCQQQAETFHGQADVLNELESYLGSGKTVPLILQGGTGSGKTAIAAVCTKYLSPKTVCVARFVGVSRESFTINQIFRSACEQIACLYGEHIAAPSGSMESLQKHLLMLLDKVTGERPLVLILDGVDQLESSISDFDWLPKVLPPHVKMVLTCNSNESRLYSLLKSYLGDSAIFLDIPPLKPVDSSKLLDFAMKRISRTFTDEQYTTLRGAITKCPNPLFVEVTSQIAATVRSYSEQTELRLGNDISSQISILLDYLEERYGATAVKHVLSYLTLCRYGIRDGEMVDVLSCDDAVLDSMFANISAVLRRVPCLLWMALSLELKTFLVERTLNDMHLTSWKYPCFAEVVRKRYLSRDAERKQLHRNLQDYFQGRWSKKKKPFNTEGGIEAQGDRYVLSQPEKYENYANVRKFQELPFHAFKAGERDFAKKFIWNADWISRKMQCCSVYEFMSDISLLSSSSNSEDPDLVTLQGMLELSSHALMCSGAQLFPHLQQRIKLHSKLDKANHPRISKLLESAIKHHILRHTLSEGILGHSLEGVEDGENTPLPAITRIFRMKDNPSHVISLSTSRKEAIVWDILSRKAVRTLKGVDSPRDMRFIDDHKVVILCNRELKIFNLDHGTFETKLKGIMNLGMPYFALHDQDHVVALARNRMNVNVINVESGDIVSTFKAGEDRFINSLLVSANGQRCVCGDETQKPSPLLVWDLQNRKLIHDFRIQQHEFVTKMAAISTDGHYVVSVIRELEDISRNFVIVYDLQSGQLFKKWKPPVNTTCVDISSEGMCVINGCEDAVVLVWDLVSGSLKHKLVGHTHPIDTLCLSEKGTHCLTYDSTNHDRSVILWSLKTGECLACITPDLPVSCCQISADGSCAVMGLVGYPDIVTVRLLDEHGKPKEIEHKPFGDPSRKGKVFELAGSIV